MFDSVEHSMLHLAILRALLQHLAILDADKRARNDDEARQEDPRAERREQVVRARYGVQT